MNKRFNLLVCLVLLMSCASGPPRKSPEIKRAELFFSYGTQKLVRGDYKGALSDLQKAHKLDAENLDITNNLAMAYYLRGDHNSGMNLVRKIIKNKPDYMDARVNYASMLFNLNKYKSAIKQYKKVLENLTYDKQYRTHYNLGLAYLRLRKLSLAEDHFKAAIKENTNYCPAFFEYGRLLEDKRQWEQALETLSEGTKGECYKEPAPFYQIALIHHKMGEKEKAWKKYEDIITRFPGSEYAKQARNKMGLFKDQVSGSSAAVQKKYSGKRFNKKIDQNSSPEVPQF